VSSAFDIFRNRLCSTKMQADRLALVAFLMEPQRGLIAILMKSETRNRQYGAWAGVNAEALAKNASIGAEEAEWTNAVSKQ